MISIFQAIILGLLQWFTELFPISSLGHSVILPHLVGWNINQNDPFFLDFLVATHFATALVLFIFFIDDWVRIIKGILRSLKEREISEKNTDAKLGWLLIVGTIPAGIIGILFEDSLRQFFASPRSAALFLLLNGILLYIGELLRKRKKENSDISGSDQRIAKLSFFQSVKVGVLQCLALIPGFSRTGATLVGSLLVGLSHEDAARFSFLLATPIIGGAALLKLPELLAFPDKSLIASAVVGALTAAIGAYFSVKFLVKYFQTKTLTPFAVYCLIAGGLVSLLFLR